jgi:DNA-directed RNA polymerase II subunit RPB1
VDPLTATSSCPQAVVDALGIEAGRAVLEAELRAVLEFNGAFVNARHLGLLADAMTHSGGLRAANRHGFHATDVSPLKRATFEMPVCALVAAARGGERDPLAGVSECIMLGRAPTAIGTGLRAALLLDPVRLAGAVRYTTAATDGDGDGDDDAGSSPFADAYDDEEEGAPGSGAFAPPGADCFVPWGAPSHLTPVFDPGCSRSRSRTPDAACFSPVQSSSSDESGEEEEEEDTAPPPAKKARRGAAPGLVGRLGDRGALASALLGAATATGATAARVVGVFAGFRPVG